MKAERSCLILLNGELAPSAALRRLARSARGVLCADGGLRHAAALRLRPDFVVGDMDSLPKPLPRFPDAVYWCDFDADRSDFEKALDLALDLGCERAYVAGALGGRLDHMLVNLALVERYSARLDVELVDASGRARLLGPGRHALETPRGRSFSLLAAPKAVVTLAGARYPLRRFRLEAGSRGLSNVALGRPALTVHKGRVWALTA